MNADRRAGSLEEVKLGEAILGYRRKGNPKRKPLSWNQVVAFQRWNELARVTAYRREQGLDAGPPIGWATVLANLAGALSQQVDVSSVSELTRQLGLPQIDPDVVAGVARDVETSRRVWRAYRLLSAAATGALIQLTVVERSECEIVRIDAWEESSTDRKRRMARDRQRKKRQKA